MNKKIYIVHIAEEHEECLCNIYSSHSDILEAMDELRKAATDTRHGVITEHPVDDFTNYKYWDEDGRDWE